MRDGRRGLTHNFGADHGDSVVVQLVLEQQHLVEEHDLLPGLQLLQVDAVRCLADLQRRHTSHTDGEVAISLVK